MKKLVSKLFLITMICCMFAVPSFAAPSAAKVKSAYAAYLKRTCSNGTTTRHCIVDIDGDGIQELILFRNINTPSQAAVDFYMYRNGKVAKLTVDRAERGCSKVFRIRGTKNFALTKDGKGGSKFMMIYKKSGNKVKLVSKYSREYDPRTKKFVYLKDGKRISLVKYTSATLKLVAWKLVR